MQIVFILCRKVLQISTLMVHADFFSSHMTTLNLIRPLPNYTSEVGERLLNQCLHQTDVLCGGASIDGLRL